MDSQYVVHSVLIFISCGVTASVTLYSWRHRNTEGAILFTWHIGLISILAFSEGLSLLGSTPAQALFWFNIRFISIAGMPLTWLLFAFRYTGRHAWLTPRRMAGLAVIPVVTQVMIWTNGMHGLWVRRQVEFFRAGPFMIADTSARVSSIWFWVHAAYSYTLSSLALILIVYAALRSATSPRRHVAAVVFGALCIISSTILPTFQLIPGLMINPTVPGTTLGTAALAWAFFRYRLINVVPIARNRLIDSMYEAMLVVDAHNQIVDLNPAMLYILTMALKSDTPIVADEVIGRPVREVCASWNEFLECFEKLVDTEIGLEYGGKWHYYDMRMSSLTGQRNRLMGHLFVLYDVTERKHAEDALRESEEKFRELAELLPAMVFEIDLDGTCTYTNQRGFATTGYTQQDFEQGINAFRLIVPDDHERIRRYMTDALNGISPVPYECTIMRKDGSTFLIMVYSSLIIRNHQPVGFRGISIDMTERKRLEEQLLQSQKMEAVGQLAGGVAHDFNTLLGIILGYGEMLREEIPDGTFVRDSLEEVIDAGNRAKALVRQLLDFARPSKRDRHPIHLDSVVEDSARLLRSSLPTTIRIRQHIEAGSAMIMANSTQITQVIMNLGMNAGDAIYEQGGTITIDLAEVEVDEGVAQLQAITPGAYLRLSISDTGRGMSPNTLEHMFEPFFTTKAVGKGSGLGLAIVHGIVKSHRGFIMVESESGKGSTFKVYLPTIE